MSGLTGLIGRLPEGRWPGALASATALLRHRGPDGQGVLLFRSATAQVDVSESAGALPSDAGPAPGACLGYRHMAVPGEAPGGSQPLSSADGRLHLMLDGEIYNAPELRSELIARGHRFGTAGDAEVVLAGLAAEGAALLPRLRGMFALALLDLRERRVLLARDHFGIRPLYYGAADGGLAFASEIRAVLSWPGVGRRIHPARLFTFLDHLDTDDAEATLFAGVRQLLPGSCATIAIDTPTQVRLERYASPVIAPASGLSPEDSAARFRAEFLDSMRRQLRGTGPIGVALSGGLDSSAVAVAARTVAGPDRPLHTFTFVPTSGAVSEERFARAAQERAGATWHAVHLEPATLQRDFRQLLLDQGEPFHGPTICAQRMIFQAARDAGVGVVLEGQGSDEYLAGYDRYFTSRALSLLRAGRWVKVARFAGRLGPLRGALLLRAAFRMGLPGGWQTRLHQWRYGRSGSDGATRWEWFAERGVRPEPEWRPVGRWAMHQHSLHTLLGNPMQALLRYGDRNAMAASVQNRVPFLHLPLVELAFSFPEEHLLTPDGIRKAVLRRALADLLPREILDRTDKVGFATPVVEWLRVLRPWVEAQLEAAGALPFFDRAAIQRHWERLLRGDPGADPRAVWRCIGLAVWVEAYGVEVD